MRVLGVAEIVLSVSDLPAMRRFYQTVLGFPLHSEACHEHGAEAEPGGEPTISFLVICQADTPLGRHAHPTMLVLIDHRRHYFARQRLVGHDPTRSTLNHLAFEIPPDSHHQAYQRLQQLGLAPTLTEFPALGAKSIFLRDPEGNTLELICHADTPSVSQP